MARKAQGKAASEPVGARQVFEYRNLPSSKYIMTKLAQINAGACADADFIVSKGADAVCKTLGVRANWAGKTRNFEGEPTLTRVCFAKRLAEKAAGQIELPA